MTNDYEEKQEAKRQRLLDRADKARKKAGDLHKKAHDMAGQIPFGQPILVGHHSEGRDRRFRGKIHDTFGKSFAESEKAEHYEQRAASVGTGGISSDDPEAIDKLKLQLESLQENHAMMKAVNGIVRKKPKYEDRLSAIEALGFSEETAKQILTPNCFNRVGFESCTLRNNSANMHRVQERIETLSRQRERTDKTISGAGYTYHEKIEDNRIWFVFPGKPEPATRLLLKSHGFRWSPSRTAWVRQLNNHGLYEANLVKKALDAASSV